MKNSRIVTDSGRDGEKDAFSDTQFVPEKEHLVTTGLHERKTIISASRAANLYGLNFDGFQTKIWPDMPYFICSSKIPYCSFCSSLDN